MKFALLHSEAAHVECTSSIALDETNNEAVQLEKLFESYSKQKALAMRLWSDKTRAARGDPRPRIIYVV